MFDKEIHVLGMSCESAPKLKLVLGVFVQQHQVRNLYHLVHCLPDKVNLNIILFSLVNSIKWLLTPSPIC